MTKTVLDVGNCDPDHNSIRKMLTSNYDVTVLRTNQLIDTLELLNRQKIDLVVINRKLDVDYSDGIEILRHLKQDPTLKSIPAMIITNYPDQQTAAVKEGAEHGFGKLQYSEPATHERLSRFLDKKTA